MMCEGGGEGCQQRVHVNVKGGGRGGILLLGVYGIDSGLLWAGRDVVRLRVVRGWVVASLECGRWMMERMEEVNIRPGKNKDE